MLAIDNSNSIRNYLIKKFSIDKLNQNRRFLTDITNSKADQSYTQLGNGQVVQSDCNESGSTFVLNGYFSGRFVIRPIVLNQTNQFLFYQISDKQSNEADSV